MKSVYDLLANVSEISISGQDIKKDLDLLIHALKNSNFKLKSRRSSVSSFTDVWLFNENRSQESTQIIERVSDKDMEKIKVVLRKQKIERLK